MREIESNKDAWSKLSKAHYEFFKEKLLTKNHKLNKYIEEELGDLKDKTIIHLQCNTGADTIKLAQMGAKKVIGVDLVPENIHYAKKMAEDVGVTNVDFFQCDIMELSKMHDEKYDVVFTSEGAIGWLPDLSIWANTIRKLLKEDGYFYTFDLHPFYLMFDESRLLDQQYDIKYPYFDKKPDCEESIGGYASDRVDGVKAYFWMYTVSNLVNNLSSAGMHIEFFNEFTENFFCGNGEVLIKGTGLYEFEHNKNKFPITFSLKATPYKK